MKAISAIKALAAIALASLGMTGEASADASGEKERVLNPIRVSAPAPHLGTLMVRPVIASRENVPVSSVELIFAPVDYADGAVTPATTSTKTDRHLIGAVVPNDLSDWERSEAGMAGATQKVYLPSGHYVISQVRYRYGQGETERSDIFCLSDQSFVFRVGMMETIFMGRLHLHDPRTPPDGKTFRPIELADAGSERLKGWRKGGGQVAVFTADPVSFTPGPSICPPESIHTAGWSGNTGYD